MLKARSTRYLAAVSLSLTSMLVGVTTATGAGAATIKAHATTTPVYDVGIVTSKMRWLFPVTDPAYNTVTNVLKFQQPQYRPLVWYGLGSSNTVQWPLSIANVPTVTNGGLTYTVTLKDWKFSNGTDINAKSVIFFMNMIKAEAGNWAGYTPGIGYPDKLTNVVQGANDHTVVFTMSQVYNGAWYIANALGLITPMPRAWDIQSDGDAAGSGGCGDKAYTAVPAWDDANGEPSANSDCQAVFDYLVSRGGGTADTLAHHNDALWKIASGPYKLDSYSPSTWTAKLVPNPAYSGPKKATVAVQFHRYTDIVSYVAALKSGVLDSGGLPTDQLTPATSLAKVGKPVDKAMAKNFTGYPSFTWGYTFAYLNFNSVSGPAVLKSLAVRKALQYGVDQKGMIKSIYNGYGAEGCSVIPAINNPDAPKTCPYSYSPTKAIAALKAAGWSVPKLGAATCTKTGGCGTGIPVGTKLTLNFEYLSTPGSQFDTMIGAEVSAWAKVGISVVPHPVSEQAIQTDCFAGDDPVTGENGNWDICEYGGWQFGAYPSGEGIFVMGAGGNSGDVDDATLTAKALEAVTGTSATAMKDFATYGATYLPYLFQPNTFGVALVNKKVKDALPPNSLGDFNPEYITATS
ncbi:MAG: ABC transporter substrate-binding protein [Actinomycetes bacterium]